MKDESQLKLADVEFQRSKTLLSRKVVSREEFNGTRPPGHGEGLARRDQGQAEDSGFAFHQRGRGRKRKRTEVRIGDATLKSPVKGRVLYRLAEPAEVVPLGGKILTLINLGDVYMEIFLPGARGRPGRGWGPTPGSCSTPGPTVRAPGRR